MSCVLKRFIGFQSEVHSRITIIEGKYFNFCEINGSRDDNNDQADDDNDEGHKIVDDNTGKINF